MQVLWQYSWQYFEISWCAAGAASAAVPVGDLHPAGGSHLHGHAQADIDPCAPLSSGPAAHSRDALLWHQLLLHSGAAGQEICVAVQSGGSLVLLWHQSFLHQAVSLSAAVSRRCSST